jgi:hypothetical protein
MSETSEKDESSKSDSSPNLSKDLSALWVFEKDEGPGLVGVHLSHVKEYLRDLVRDDRLPAEERAKLRTYFSQREQKLHAKLVLFEKKENVQSWGRWLQTTKQALELTHSGESANLPNDLVASIPNEDQALVGAQEQHSAAQEGLAKAQAELHAAALHLQSLFRASPIMDAQEAEARKWRLTRKWEAITPDELKPAVEGARHTIEHYGFWQSKQSAEKLCYAALHPSDPSANEPSGSDDLVPYRRFLVGLLGSQTEQKLLNADHPASVIFKSYSDVLQSAMKLLIRRGFRLILEIAEAGSSVLDLHPVEWTKRQIEILISAEKSGIRSWAQGVCDPPNLSAATLTDDSIYGGEWRAPRLIHMRPAGNTAYDAATCWSREALVKSQEILDGFAIHFTTFLKLELDEVAREAHFQFIKRNGIGSPTWQAKERVSPLAPISTQSVGGNQTPEVWHGLREKFRTLADEEAKLAPSNVPQPWLRAFGDYKGESSSGQWLLSAGVNEYLREHFEVEATRAGIALGSAVEGEPLSVWLHHLYSHLLENKSKLLIAASKEGGTIIKVIEASAIYCTRMEKLAIIRAGQVPPVTPEERRVVVPVKESEKMQTDVSANASRESALREAVIKKVQSPERYTVLSIPETALYFETSERTIHRWLADRSLKPGARRSSVTIESILALKTKKQRKNRPQ